MLRKENVGWGAVVQIRENQHQIDRLKTNHVLPVTRHCLRHGFGRWFVVVNLKDCAESALPESWKSRRRVVIERLADSSPFSSNRAEITDQTYKYITIYREI